MTAEITLAAALRDCTHDDPQVRNIGVRNLAPAYLEEHDLESPSWRGGMNNDTPRTTQTAEHQAVGVALHHAIEDPLPQIAGLALLGLGEIGDHSVLRRAYSILDECAAHAQEQEQRHEAAVFLRECSLMCMSRIASSARQALSAAASSLPASERELAIRCVDDVRARLLAALDSVFDDLRFHAGVAIVELGGTTTEADVVRALRHEENLDVRENHVRALTMLDPPGQVACDALAELLFDENSRTELGFDAALALAGARRHEGGPRLVDALHTREHRDRALEALAALGPSAPEQAAKTILGLTRQLFLPRLTRVRAAYALARVSPMKGLPMLARLGRSLRPSIRHAVAEARANLRVLETNSPRQSDPYRSRNES